jgi:GT2 family glycosyltransferase
MSIFETHRDFSNGKIFIVDNCSPDGSGHKLKTIFSNNHLIHVIVSGRNLGFSGGNNLGIKEALKDHCDFIFFLNSDIILLNDSITKMLTVFATDNKVVACCPSVYDSNGKYVQFARKGLTLKSYLFGKKQIKWMCPEVYKNSRFYKYDSRYDYKFDGMGSGCCFALRSDFIRQYDCLDDCLFMYYEEDILAHIIHDNALKTCIVSNAKVLHKEGVSTARTLEDKLQFTRMYRWTSALYVLKYYAKVSGFICEMIALLNISIWYGKSILDKKYRKSLDMFIAETKRVLKGE